MTWSIKKLSDEADAKLQDCFASTDWNMFRDSFDGIEKYTTSVTGFFNKCIDDVIPTVTVRTYPNQRPWITGNIRTELIGRAAAFKEPSKMQSVFTGLRSNHTIPALMLVRCGRAMTTKGTFLNSTLPFPTWTKGSPT